MSPAVLTDLVGGIRIETLSRAQLLDQLTTELGLAGLLVALGLYLAQPLRSAADHELRQSHALAAAAQRIERLAY